MSITPRTRRRASFWLLATLLLSQILGLGVAPQTAQAAATAPNAEPSEELVYLDNEGFIRIYDRESNPDLPGNPTIDWSSPSGGWQFLTLGDFNNDTDLEVAALRQVGNNFEWAVFDPVVARGATNPDRKTPNGIPWDILYEAPAEPGVIKFIEAGNFDDGIPGDELIIGWRDANNRYYVRVVKAASLDSTGNPTGRDWEEHLIRDFSERYSVAASGQLNGGGADEIVLLDNDSTLSKLDVFQVDNDFARLDGKNSDNDSYRHVAIGQIIAGGPEEIAVGLSTSRADKESIIVYEMEQRGGAYEMVSDEDWQWAFAPNPEHVFLADIFGNGDSEVFFIRKYPEGEDGPRLIMRDDWGGDRDRLDEPIEESLGDVGDDNGFRPGVGADVDGDGKDEIVIMRDDRIRIYTRPDESMSDSTIVEHHRATDAKTLLAGNLDATGFIEGPTFGVNQTRIEANVPIGTVSGNYQVQVTNISTPDPVTFNVTKPGDAPWLSINPTVATTPATINVTFNATGLETGTYTSQLTLNANNVLNSPFIIEVELTVLPAVLTFRDAGVAHITYPCVESDEDPDGETDILTVRVGGTAGLNYRAALIALPGQTTAASQDVTAAAIADAVAGAELADNGDIILYDAQGNTRTIPTGIPAGQPAGGDVSASAVLSTAWPIDSEINWVTSVSSDATSVPSNLRFEFDTSVLGDEYTTQQAVMVLVADTRAGSPPENVFALPVSTMCAQMQLDLPLVLR